MLNIVHSFLVTGSLSNVGHFGLRLGLFCKETFCKGLTNTLRLALDEDPEGIDCTYLFCLRLNRCDHNFPILGAKIR